MISESRGGVSRFLHSGIKNAGMQTNSSQTIAASKKYDAFGNVTSSSGTWNGPFAYGGKFGYQSDADSGLMLLGHRMYDASTGRFLTRDPAKDGRNWYAYVANNPVLYADPSGEWLCLIPAAVALVAVIYTASTGGCEAGVDAGATVVGAGGPAGLIEAVTAAHVAEGLTRLAAWAIVCRDPVIRALIEEKPGVWNDPRPYGFPKWRPLGEYQPSMERLTELRSQWHRSEGIPLITRPGGIVALGTPRS